MREHNYKQVSEHNRQVSEHDYKQVSEHNRQVSEHNRQVNERNGQVSERNTERSVSFTEEIWFHPAPERWQQNHSLDISSQNWSIICTKLYFLKFALKIETVEP